MTPFLSLDDPRSLDPRLAGGKGAGLARLHAAGFSVPPAIVLPPRSADALAAGDLDDSMLAAITAIAGPTGRVAVRSSATDEDSAAASFAGQHETILGVEPTVAAIREAIALCLASTAAASAYRESRGLDESPMAIVIQRMVDPEVAGVAFTIDPVTGDPNSIVIEAVHGLGDTLVGGEQPGERTVLARDTLSPLLPSGGASVLPVEHARAVARVALEVEASLGGPQDIEFALAGGQVWLLQARPVTGIARGEFDTPTTPADHWTAANIQEVLPGLLTPLSITIFQANADTGYGEGYEKLRLLRKGERPRFVGMFYNRAFLNIGATRLIADRAFGSSGDAVEHRFLGGEYREEGHRPHTLEHWQFRLKSIPFLVWMTLGIERKGKQVEAEAIRLERKLRTTDLRAKDDLTLDRIRLKLARFGADTFRVHLQTSAVAALGFDRIASIVRPLLGAEAEGRLPALFSGIRGLESAEIGVDLYDLAALASKAGLGPTLREPGFDPASPAHPEAWQTAYAAFMDRHGHRGINEMEFSAIAWRRDPSPLLPMLVSYLDLPAGQAPEAALQRQAKERESLTADLTRRLRPWQRPSFRLQLSYAQRWVASRERTKSAVVRATRLADFVLPEVERRLLERGALADPGGLYFLTTDEITALLGAQHVERVRERVARRRREYERNSHLLLPERFHGYPVPVAADAGHVTGDVLTGTPVSPGVATGPARVIRDPAIDGPLREGEVLVAPVTDAGWTPLFALAAGLVVDMGSALSHGSTIAREYGLPAVVNVRSATRTIRDGDLVRVDGYAGTVTLIREDESV